MTTSGQERTTPMTVDHSTADSDPDSNFGPDQLRRVFGTFPTGVTAVAALIDSRPVGLAVSSFTSVSLDPALVSVCVAHTSTTWPTLRRATHFGLSVLAEGQTALCRRLSSRTTDDRFAGASWHATSQGAVLLEEANAWLECTIDQTVGAGDHDIVVLKVASHRVHPGRSPLVFHASRFRLLGRHV